MFCHQKLTYPCDQMVFKGTLDDLVEDISGNELMNICTREIIRERLVSIAHESKVINWGIQSGKDIQ